MEAIFEQGTKTCKSAKQNPIIFSVPQSNVLGHVLWCDACTGVQVSLEDAEVLLGTAERTNIADQATYVPYKVQTVNTVMYLQSNNM